MKEHHYAILRPLVIESALGLFDACGLTMKWAGEPEPPLHIYDGVAAIIGFAGAQLNGSVAIGMETQVLRRLYEQGVPGAPPIDADMRDWIRELSNQLLGRFKNRLLDLSICFQVSIPMCLVGRELECLPGNGDATRRILFCDPRDEQAQVHILFDVEAEPGLTFGEAATEPAHLSEGGMLLFD